MTSRHRTESLTSPRRMEAVDRQRRAVELRLAGLTLQEIADALGYKSHNSADAAIKTALQKTLVEPCAEFRQLTLERLEKILRTHWPNMLRGDIPASNICLKTIGDMRQLMGADLPSRVEHTGPDGSPIQHEVITFNIDHIEQTFNVLRDAGAVRMATNGHVVDALDVVNTTPTDT